ncbi:hypothetical protein WA026_010418 [Henosepilachna vigintioctopunctata]|uniref:Uncharacterized protein n=1 Tax=Henosepilachna vigintioctopunctata TaxID=420089 RepID=A0AAW1VBE5_9CUCU
MSSISPMSLSLPSDIAGGREVGTSTSPRRAVSPLLEDRMTVKNNTTQQMTTTPYEKGISERLIDERYNIKTAFKSVITVRSTLAKIRPDGPHESKDCIYLVPCQCGVVYIEETMRPPVVRFNEHKLHTRREETSKS